MIVMHFYRKNVLVPTLFLKLLLGLIESLVNFLRITSPALRLNLSPSYPFIVSQIRDPIHFEVHSTLFTSQLTKSFIS
jgi:hypothetical protein